MSNQTNRRNSVRLNIQEALSLTIISTTQSPELEGKVFNGSTMDISTTGLRLMLSSPLPPNSIINMSITLENAPNEFLLSGKVRWCREFKQEDTYQAGIVLHKNINDEIDYNRWREAVK